MKTTLLPGDFILINKFRFSWFSQKWNHNQVLRNEVLVFRLKSGYMVKRSIGLPGESLQIVNDSVFINNQFLPDIQAIRRLYRIWYSLRSTTMQVLEDHDLNASKNEIQFKTKFISIYLSKQEYSQLLNNSSIDSITIGKNQDRTSNVLNLDDRDNYANVHIPYKGMVVYLTSEVFNSYRHILINYERIELNAVGLPKYPSHTFQNDYYFFMGDNRCQSEDSRSYGIIPHAKLVGSLIHIYR
jgi:signal peptidase I